MTAALGLVAVLLAIAALLTVLLRTDARRIALALRIAGPALLALVGVGMMALGRAGVGGMLLSLSAGWYSFVRSRRRVAKPVGQRSTVRTAALEMELDHDTGALEGMVLAGSYEQKMLSSLSLAQLLLLYRELSSDFESRRLLETYLDGRVPAWRDHVEANRDDRHGVAPGSGAMTKEEAYQILGLEAGATAADIRKAHRRLMQRLHPDIGGTSFLAARINEAKDVLLSDHN